MSTHICEPRPERLERLRRVAAILQSLGTHGATVQELDGLVQGWCTSNLRTGLRQLEKRGDIYALRRHPVVLFYAASVPQHEAQAAFDARTPALLTKHSHKGKPRGPSTRTAKPKAGSELACFRSPRKRHLPAVDPNGLRKDAQVSVPDHVQVQICASGQDMRRRADPGHRGPLRTLGLGRYEEPPSSWVQALTTTPRA